MKQDEIAAKIGRSQAFVSMFFRGKTGCSWPTAKKLSSLLGRSPGWWMEATAAEKQAVLNGGQSETGSMGDGVAADPVDPSFLARADHQVKFGR